MSKKSKFPGNRGAILVEGQQQASFWIRAFQLGEQIDRVRAKVAERPERKVASAPIIGHYIVDENLEFYYVLSFDVDSLGARDMLGKIFYCSPEHRDQAIKLRNEIGVERMNDVLNCAKCGSDNIRVYQSCPPAALSQDLQDFNFFWGVECNDCHHHNAHFWSKLADAIREWNERKS